MSRTDYFADIKSFIFGIKFGNELLACIYYLAISTTLHIQIATKKFGHQRTTDLTLSSWHMNLKQEFSLFG